MPDTSPGFVIDLETRRRIDEQHRELSAEQVYDLDATQKDARAAAVADLLATTGA